MNDSPLDAEVTTDVNHFDHFGRSWSVPNKRHQSHIRKHKDIARREGQVDADDIAAIYLPTDEYEALCALDPTEAELYEFAGKIAAALGMGSQGNSQPSSTSS